MLVTASGAVVFGLITVVLVRSQRVSTGSAVAVWLSGFTAASTGLAGPVNSALTALAHALSTIH
ncbi:hypothetical protein ACFV6F_04060 [Kitasatospora phosalacinea]|uniref:hypothetical protein n=1 Tax=Kitasatospora phosalacinea TaxID=2065 RepID=UPI0036585F6A